MSVISKSQNFVHLLASREFGAQVPLFSNQGLIQNIKEGNYTKTISNGFEERIKGFDVQGDFVATVSNTIKLWNLKTGEYLWTFVPSPKVCWRGRIEIVEGNIICAGQTETSERNIYNNTIRIIDLKTGVEKSAITDRRLEIDKICTVGRRIFCIRKDGNIGEWDFDGRFIRWRLSEKLFGMAPQFLGLGKFLVYACGNNIVIRDMQKGTVRNFELNVAEQEKLDISSAHIDGCRLICGFKAYKTRGVPDFCVIDLESEVVERYEVTRALSGKIQRIITNKEWAYVGHSTGVIVAVNLIEKNALF